MQGLELSGRAHINHHEVLVLVNPGAQGLGSKGGNGGSRGRGSHVLASQKVVRWIPHRVFQIPPRVVNTPRGVYT